MSSKPGPKARPPAWGLRQTMQALRDDLAKTPAWASVSAHRAALAHLEAMNEEWYELLEAQRRLPDLIADYNRIYAAARARGVEVYQLAGNKDWTWTRGARTGHAPTPEEALVEALDAA